MHSSLSHFEYESAIENNGSYSRKNMLDYTSIKISEVKLVFWAQNTPRNKWCGHDGVLQHLNYWDKFSYHVHGSQI
jgi:hypothetical protein